MKIGDKVMVTMLDEHIADWPQVLGGSGVVTKVEYTDESWTNRQTNVRYMADEFCRVVDLPEDNELWMLKSSVCVLEYNEKCENCDKRFVCYTS